MPTNRSAFSRSRPRAYRRAWSSASSPVRRGRTRSNGSSAREMRPIRSGPEVAPDDVAAERQRQPGLLLPPSAQVHDGGEAFVARR